MWQKEYKELPADINSPLFGDLSRLQGVMTRTKTMMTTGLSVIFAVTGFRILWNVLTVRYGYAA